MRAPPPCCLSWVLGWCRGTPRSASVPMCCPPHAHRSHPYPLLRRAASALIFVHVSDPRSRSLPRPLPPRCLIISSSFAHAPQHSSFTPIVHSRTCQESFQVLAGCVGGYRRCIQLWRVRSVLTFLLSLLLLLRRVILHHHFFLVSHLTWSHLSLLSYTTQQRLGEIAGGRRRRPSVGVMCSPATPIGGLPSWRGTSQVGAFCSPRRYWGCWEVEPLRWHHLS